MDRRKQIIVLVALFVLMAARGFCFEVTWEYEAEVDEKLEKLQIYFETEMYEEAAELLSELVTQFPDEPRFSYLKAIVDYQRGHYAQAQDVFLEFTREYPDVPEPYYLLSEINLRNENLKQARKYLAQYCILVPDDFDAQRKLNSISSPKISSAIIIHNGKEDPRMVKKLGFYGACVSTREAQSIKLINGSFRTWSCMGMDFIYPVDLRGKEIVLTLKGKKGGEKFELTFRDKFSENYTPQLIIVQEEGLLDDWQKITVMPQDDQSGIDLSNIVHMGFEFGFSTVRNPAQSTLYVKDIAIEDVNN